MDTPPRGQSLYADAWRRLRRNRMAILCALVVLLQALLVILSPWIAPFPPEQQELWVGARPPGYTHPELRREMLFTLGAPVDLPPRTARAAIRGPLQISAVRARREELRVVVSRERIRSITLPGAVACEEITVGPATGSPAVLEVLDTSGEAVRTVPEGRLVRGAPVPGWLADLSQGRRRWVVLLRRVETIPLQVTLEARDGTVCRLEEDGQPREELTLRAEDVEEVLDSGGEPVVHTHLLGTDDRGRDLLSRILYGGWVSLLVGLVATLVSIVIGVLYGAVSAYLGGVVDTVMMALVDILYAIPYMFLVILLLVLCGRSIVMLFVALGCVQWLTMARIVRGQVLSLREKEFIAAARVTGATRWSVIWRHLIPGTLGVVAVYATLTIPAVILQEAFLGFIGLTVEYQGRAIDSWGSLVNAGRQALGSDGQLWWLLVFPSAALGVMLFCLNFLGDGLREALDPRMRGRT